jgi:hypothetical protein
MQRKALRANFAATRTCKSRNGSSKTCKTQSKFAANLPRRPPTADNCELRTVNCELRTVNWRVRPTPASAPAAAEAPDRAWARAGVAASPGPARDSAGVGESVGERASALWATANREGQRRGRHRPARASRVRCVARLRRRLRVSACALSLSRRQRPTATGGRPGKPSTKSEQESRAEQAQARKGKRRKSLRRACAREGSGSI